MTDTDTVLVERDGSVTIVSINRPHCRNAVDGRTGLNDTWGIPALDAFTHFTVTIFNRWGGIVFQAKNTNKHWDGKFKGLPQPAGEYVYIVNLEELGRTLKGVLLLIR